MAEQRNTEEMMVGITQGADAAIRDTSSKLLSLDINATTTQARATEQLIVGLDINQNAQCRGTEIVFLSIRVRAGGGVFRELITPMTSHDE